MSHSPRRATARIDCRGVRRGERLIEWSVLAPASTAAATSALRAAFEKESIEQQQDHGADDRHDPAGDIILARKMRPIQVPTSAPAIPSRIVMMQPPGSFPGINSFAIAPITRPTRMVQMIE